MEAEDAAGGRRPSEDLLSEQAYLVSRGVRALALVGQCQAEPLEMLRVATVIEGIAVGYQHLVPFVLDRGDGHADYGFARCSWVVDLLEWTVKGGCPDAVKHQVLGLLLGYSPEEIGAHALNNGRRFDYSSLLTG